MNTGFLGPAVATVLTVYGIETLIDGFSYSIHSSMLQQYLPFTVLKLATNTTITEKIFDRCNSTYRLRY